MWSKPSSSQPYQSARGCLSNDVNHWCLVHASILFDWNVRVVWSRDTGLEKNAASIMPENAVRRKWTLSQNFSRYIYHLVSFALRVRERVYGAMLIRVRATAKKSSLWILIQVTIRPRPVCQSSILATGYFQPWYSCWNVSRRLVLQFRPKIWRSKMDTSNTEKVGMKFRSSRWMLWRQRVVYMIKGERKSFMWRSTLTRV